MATRQILTNRKNLKLFCFLKSFVFDLHKSLYTFDPPNQLVKPTGLGLNNYFLTP